MKKESLAISTPNSKTFFRNLAKNNILTYSEHDRLTVSQSVLKILQKILTESNIRQVISFRADSWEIDLLSLSKTFPDINFFYPKVLPGGQMEFIKPTEGWKLGSFQIWEPLGEEKLLPIGADSILVPGLGFHKQGYRLGRGKGYYDRCLQSIPQKKLFGIIWDKCKGMDFKFEDHDIKMGWCISEKGIQGFLD